MNIEREEVREMEGQVKLERRRGKDVKFQKDGSVDIEKSNLTKRVRR
jgi:hypothetical protein